MHRRPARRLHGSQTMTLPRTPMPRARSASVHVHASRSGV